MSSLKMYFENYYIYEGSARAGAIVIAHLH